MNLKIDEIDLPQFVVGVGDFYNPPLKGEAVETRGGTRIRWIKTMKDVPFDIKSPENVQCTGGLLSALKNLAASDTATTTHVLTIEDYPNVSTQTYTVRLRMEDQPVIMANPVLEYVPQQDSSIYDGLTIKLSRIYA